MIVIKVGGGAGIDVDAVLRDLAARPHRDWVLVHGASDETNQLSERLGKPPEFITSVSGHTSRRTDSATLDHFAMASGKLNLRIVERLQQLGVNAVGLTGVDGRLLEGQRKDHVKAVVNGKRIVIRDDFTGTVERVNVHLLRTLLEAGFTPVVTVPAISYNAEAVNADADRAAAAIAGALGAEALLILSNVPGLLRDVNDPESLVTGIPAAEIGHFEGFAQGRFKKKVLGAEEALALGVGRVTFATANRERPVERAFAGEACTSIYKPGCEPGSASVRTVA